MQPNPVLRKLGFSDTDRVAIIHTDDIGMCQASVTAYQELTEFGLISSAAVMAPCPWFLEAARYIQPRPGLDVGVHLTLTSEWETYRWGPLSTRDHSSGLLDEQGCFYHDNDPVHAHADADAAICELQAQIAAARAAGIHPTHIDTHMGTLGHPRLMPGYLQLALQHRLPPMLFRMDEAGWMTTGMDAQSAAAAAQVVVQAEEMGLPLLDAVFMMSLKEPEERFEQAKRAFAGLPAGVTHFILHPSVDTPELRALAPDWRCRVADCATFQDERLRAYLQDIGIQVIGYRPIQELMESALP
jgi:chitin disaccharide deacetylase